MIQRVGYPASLNAQALEAKRCVSLSKSHQLVGGKRQNTEHQMAHHFGIAFHHQVSASELVFEPRIAAFSSDTVGSEVVRSTERESPRLLPKNNMSFPGGLVAT